MNNSIILFTFVSSKTKIISEIIIKIKKYENFDSKN